MEATLSFLLDHSNDFFCVLDQRGIIKRTNAALRKTLGYSEAEITGKQINEISHPADVRRRTGLLKSLHHKQQIAEHESRIRAIDGRYYNIKWSLAYNPPDDLIYATGINLTNKLIPDNNISDNIQHIIQSFNEGFFVIDSNWNITGFNPAFQAITGFKTKQLKNVNIKTVHSLGLTGNVLREFEAAFNEKTSSQLQYFNTFSKRWLRINIYPYKNDVMIFIHDITSSTIQQLVLALEKRVLEINASTRYTLKETINELLNGIEAIFPGMICSVIEVDETQEKIRHFAGPSLPEAYSITLNDLVIGPKTGSCGTAAYHRKQIIVSDIETDPLWDDYREFARPHGLKACWSTPVISSFGTHVLATFAIYYTTTREPKNEELQIIERMVNILRILIENQRNLDNIKNQNKRLQEIAVISSHDIRRPVATILGLVSLFDTTHKKPS